LTQPRCPTPAANLIIVFNDITERWRNDERARHLAFHDVLTDQPNRALLIGALGQLINLSRREQRKLALMFLDLGGFSKPPSNCHPL
jgi:GGDEF domain-containing protein